MRARHIVITIAGAVLLACAGGAAIAAAVDRGISTPEGPLDRSGALVQSDTYRMEGFSEQYGSDFGGIGVSNPIRLSVPEGGRYDVVLRVTGIAHTTAGDVGEVTWGSKTQGATRSTALRPGMQFFSTGGLQDGFAGEWRIPSVAGGTTLTSGPVLHLRRSPRNSQGRVSLTRLHVVVDYLRATPG